jgi:hypothetical protein
LAVAEDAARDAAEAAWRDDARYAAWDDVRDAQSKHFLEIVRE